MVSHCIDRLKNGHKTPVAHLLYSNLYVRFQSISRSSIHDSTMVDRTAGSYGREGLLRIAGGGERRFG